MLIVNITLISPQIVNAQFDSVQRQVISANSNNFLQSPQAVASQAALSTDNCNDLNLASVIVHKIVTDSSGAAQNLLNQFSFTFTLTQGTSQTTSSGLTNNAQTVLCVQPNIPYTITEPAASLQQLGFNFNPTYGTGCTGMATGSGQVLTCNITNQITSGSPAGTIVLPFSEYTNPTNAKIQVQITPQDATTNGLVKPGSLPIAKLTVVTKIDDQCVSSNHTRCTPIDVYDFYHVVKALTETNTVHEIAGPNEGKASGWIYPFYVFDPENGLQYYVRPQTVSSEFGINVTNITSSPDCSGTLMIGENRTCTIVFKRE